MRKIVSLVGAVALAVLFALPAAAGDCFIRSSINVIAQDGDIVAVALTNGTVWQVNPGNANEFVRLFEEGEYVKICEGWGYLYIQNLDGYSAPVRRE